MCGQNVINHDMRKNSNVAVRHVKTQIGIGISSGRSGLKFIKLFSC